MIPWYEGTTIIGTTERMEKTPCDQVKIQEEDIRYLLNCANRYLRSPICRDDICDTFLGIRPLVIDKYSETDATGMSRDYKIDVIRRGTTKLIHVFGGEAHYLPEHSGESGSSRTLGTGSSYRPVPLPAMSQIVQEETVLQL